MPKTINPIRKHLLKQNLLKGKSIRQSMKDSGYTERTSHGHCSVNNKVVNRCMTDIANDFKMTDITPENVLKYINEIRNDPEANHSDKLRANELLGKYLKMWTERTEIDNKHPDKIIISYIKDTQPIKDKEVTP